MRRRADGGFEEISWDVAVREIGAKLKQLRDEHGPRSLALAGELADGTLLGAGSPTPSTTPRVNLFGPVTLKVHATDVEETNDTIADATQTGIVGVDSPSFLGAGYTNRGRHRYAKVVSKGRLQPGKMFLIDMQQGRIIDDAELKESLADRHPYQQWLQKTQIRLENLPGEISPMAPDTDTLLDRQQAFGYSQESLKFLMLPMAQTGQEAIGSMGTDTPISALSSRPANRCRARLMPL